jgi:sulfur carrier protein
MTITLNGKSREVPDGITVRQLVEEVLKLQPARVAVQVNMDIIKRDRYGEVTVKPGDVIEVLTFMAGG